MSLAFTIWWLMMCLQLLAIYWHLDATQFNLFWATQATAPLNVEPFYKNLKLLLEIPNWFHQNIVDLEPQNTSFFNGVQWLTWASEEWFLTLLLYLTTFIYYFFITTIFAKISTIFAIERDQNIFFIFQYIIYFSIIKFLWN
jgi:hypothetical protein